MLRIAWWVRVVGVVLVGTAIGLVDPDPGRAEGVAATSQGTHGQRRMTAVRIEEAIELDGALAEEVWGRAEPATDFRQREPDEGAPSPDRTEVRILYDDTHLYVGFRLFQDPDRVIASDRRRDSRMTTDDTMAVILDTFHDHRNAFLFRVNPLGTKYDMLIRNETDLNPQWDENWTAAARITDTGWEAEIAVPLEVLRFDPENDVWGVDFRREIRDKNVDLFWSNYRRDLPPSAISQGGHLGGLDELGMGDRFRFKWFATSGFEDRNATSLPESDHLTDAGVEDFKIKLVPGLTLDLTANTDFTQTVIDSAQVNLTRFSLFFPEQREFFLEGNNNFRFGPPSQRGQRPLALLYFSRRIGLSDDREPLPIDAGAKLTGRLGPYSIGALDVQVGSTPATPANNFSVVRLQRDLLERSRVGALFTNRDGGGTFNRVFAADGNFVVLDSLNVNGWAARLTDSGLDGDRWSGQGVVDWDSDRWDFSADVLRIAPDFDTDLGFILRRDIVRQSYRAGWSPRPDAEWLRQVSFTGSFEHIADNGGELQTRESSLRVNFRLESGDSFSVDLEDSFERLEEPFRIHVDRDDPAGDVVIPVGDYDFRSARLGLNFFDGRALAGSIRGMVGEFFSGTRQQISVAPSFRVGQSVQGEVSYTFDHVDLAEGTFDTHLVNSLLSYSVNDRWLTSTVVQYSNTSDLLTLFVQLDYIYRPNDDLFVIYQQTDSLAGPFEGETDRRLAVKITHSIGF